MLQLFVRPHQHLGYNHYVCDAGLLSNSSLVAYARDMKVIYLNTFMI